MDEAVRRAFEHVSRTATGDSLADRPPVTLNFHPDTIAGGLPTITHMARDGLYRSQFETRTSNGGMTAYRGGARWAWESRIFAGAYDDADATLRPKYGALNYLQDPVGGSRRFGSCHLRLAPHVLDRTTFCYPDSHLDPQDFGVGASIHLIRLCDENKLGLDPLLDNYIEAHVHGPLCIASDVEAIVLDPSYRGTFVEEAAHALGCAVEWHHGFRLSLDQLTDCENFRGSIAADAIKTVARNGWVTPHAIGAAREDVLDYQAAKWAWHCVARLGGAE